jgi:hypothetical protein
MKQNLMAAAVAIALTVAARPADAVHLNPRGTGQVLVFPYYTVNAGNQTLLSVVNQTSAGKAVKLRFREGRNSRDVLNLNVYLAPFDVWTGTLFSQSDTGPNNPAHLTTTDLSCTVPKLHGNPSLPMMSNGLRYVGFFNVNYTGASEDAGPDTLDRTREGHFELIEMGEVVAGARGSLSAIRHTIDRPNNCAQIEQAWWPVATAGVDIAYWSANPNVDMAPPGGGLFGSASLIDTLSGTLLSYGPEAIGDFSDAILHTVPNSVAPTLASANSAAGDVTATVFQDGAIVTSTYPAWRAIDAVSALFMTFAIFDEYTTSESAGTATEWILSFPTKFAYADQAAVGSEAMQPFPRVFPLASAFNAGTASVEFDWSMYNDATTVFLPGLCIEPTDPACLPFFPPPPTVGPEQYYAVNVIPFNQGRSPNPASRILGSRLQSDPVDSGVGVQSGWTRLAFYNASPPNGWQVHRHRLSNDLEGRSWLGLPAIGFRVNASTGGVSGPLFSSLEASRHRSEGRFGSGFLDDLMFRSSFE